MYVNPPQTKKQPVRFGFDEYGNTATVDHLACRAAQILEPKTIEEALSSNKADKWRAAADSEYSSLLENKTWDLLELPPNREAIPCKWVFKVKYKEDGRIERFKARVVAKWYTQKRGIDYDETFSPVVCFSSIRMLLSFALQHSMHIHQMDVVTEFLHGNLEEEIYMLQPSGYLMKGKEDLVCRLRKSFVGLRLFSSMWKLWDFLRVKQTHVSSSECHWMIRSQSSQSMWMISS